MPRKIKVVDIPTEAFETAREEDVKEDVKEDDVKEDEVKDDYIDTKEEASKQDDLIPIPNSVNESTVIEEAKNDKPQKELVKCQYCNKNMLPKSLKYSHYQNSKASAVFVSYTGTLRYSYMQKRSNNPCIVT